MAKKTKSSRLKRRIKIRKTRKSQRRPKVQRGGQENLILRFQSNISLPVAEYRYQFKSGHIRDVYQYLNQKLYDIAAPRLALQQQYHIHSHFISQDRIYVYNCNNKDWERDYTRDNDPIYFNKIKISAPDEKEIYLSGEPEFEREYVFSADNNFYFYVSSSPPDEFTRVDTFCAKTVAIAAVPVATSGYSGYAAPLPQPPAQRPSKSYVISSHGRATPTFFSPPAPINLLFFTEDGCVLSCPNRLQTSACKEREGGKIVEQVGSVGTTRDYLLSKDKDTQWKSGVVDCTNRNIVLNLEQYGVGYEVPLSYVLNIILEYHNRRYGADTIAYVYCLFCRGGGDVVRLECSIGRRR